MPVTFRCGGGEIDRLETGGPVPGLLPGASYQEERVSVREGDVLVLFSDGLKDDNPQGEEFGEERLSHTLRALDQESAADICRRVFTELKSFAGAQPLRDDLTLMVVRVPSGRL